VDLFWIPLGAGAHAARVSGKIYETIAAFVHGRQRRDLYHSALEINTAEGRYVIEQTPVPDRHGERRGVVARGPVGMRWLGRFRIFSYEIRCWLGGSIPDVDESVGSPVRVAEDVAIARHVLDLLPSIPTPVWGRNELDAGEMWNSNSIVAWVLCRSGVELAGIHPPAGGRAPGWTAGLAVAVRGD
jgi:hypothetical protein